MQPFVGTRHEERCAARLAAALVDALAPAVRKVKGEEALHHNPVVAGSSPAGMFNQMICYAMDKARQDLGLVQLELYLNYTATEDGVTGRFKRKVTP